MLKAIIWDNDGVLVDTERLYYCATKEVLSGVGIELSIDLFIEFSLKQGESAFNLALQQGVKPYKIVELRRERNRVYRQLLLSENILIEGVEEVLQNLYGHFTMGIVTSSARDHFQTIHERINLLKYFNFFYTREDYTYSKPHPDPYLTAIRLNNIKKDECIIIEDSERGLCAAKKAGIRCLIIPNHLTRNCDFSGAYCVLDSIKEVGLELLGKFDK